MDQNREPRGLLEAIRAELGRPSLEWARPPTPLTGGFWAELWRISLDTDHVGLRGELVARIMPSPDVAAREIAVQDHLARSGYPTPAVRLSAPPGPELDRAWMLMDHARGEPLLADLSGPGALVRLPRIASALPDQLARHAAALHAIDTEPLLGAVEDAPLLPRVRDQAASIDRADLVAAADHLAQTRPRPTRLVLCHGDLHPFNILAGPGGQTVLDWSASQIADPAHDLAFTRLLLAHPPLVAPRPLRPIIGTAGRALARRFSRTYDRTAAVRVDPDQLHWHTDLHALRVVTEVASWRAQGELDQHPGHPFLTLAPLLAQRLGQRLGVGASP